MNITDRLLIDATGCTAANAGLYAAHLDEACQRYSINTPARLAAFLAQVGHESGSLRYAREIWGPTPAQARYEGRTDLGNTEPGDGFRYCGRGLVQTTGRWNYRRVTLRLRSRLGATVPDFEAEPAELERPLWAAMSAADYWDMHKLNDLADAGDFTAITRKINGGLNGQADRLARWAKAKRALSGGSLYTSQPPVQETPKTEHVAKEAPVAPLIAMLGKTLISAFAPLAAEKIQREIGRHTDRPEVAEQITDAVIGAAKAATGLEDPIEAVAEARKDPEVLAQVEASVLDKLASMAPLLERMAALDLADKAATEASYDAAAKRAAGNPNDQDTYLTQSIVRMTVGLMLLAAVLTGVLALMKVSDTILMAVFGLFNSCALLVLSKFGTRYDHRYGSSTGSAAKDVVIRNLTNGKQP